MSTFPTRGDERVRVRWLRHSVCLGCLEPWARRECDEEKFDLNAAQTRWYHERCAGSFGVQNERNVAAGLQGALAL